MRQLLAFLLTLCVSLPSPAFALRSQNAGVEENPRLTGEISDALRAGRPAAGAEESAAALAEKLKTARGFGFIDPTADEYKKMNAVEIAVFAAGLADMGLTPKIDVQSLKPLGLRVIEEFRKLWPDTAIGVAIYQAAQVSGVVSAAGGKGLIISAPVKVIADVLDEVVKTAAAGPVLAISKVTDWQGVMASEGLKVGGVEIEPAVVSGTDLEKTESLEHTVKLLARIRKERSSFEHLRVWGSAGGVNAGNAAALLADGHYVGFSIGPKSLDKLTGFEAAKKQVQPPSAAAGEVTAKLAQFRYLALKLRTQVQDKTGGDFAGALRRVLAEYPGGEEQKILGALSISEEDLLYVIVGQKGLAQLQDSPLSKAYLASQFVHENLRILPMVISGIHSMMVDTGRLVQISDAVIVGMDLRDEHVTLTLDDQRALISRVLEVVRSTVLLETVESLRGMEGDAGAQELAARMGAAGESHAFLISKALVDSAQPQSLKIHVYGHPNLEYDFLAILGVSILDTDYDEISTEPGTSRRQIAEIPANQEPLSVVAIDTQFESLLPQILPAEHPLAFLLRQDSWKPHLPFAKPLAVLLAQNRISLRNLIIRLTDGTVQAVTIQGVEYVAVLASA